jgi:hypothetical protein
MLFHLSLEIMWLQENKHKRSGKLTFYDSCHVTSRNGCHLRCHACKLSHLRCHACTPCHQSKGGKPRRIRAWHVDFTWIHGPTRVSKPPQEHMYTGDRPKGPQDSHPEKAHLEWGPPGIDRPKDRPKRPWVGWSWASTWRLSIGPRGHPRGVSLLVPVLWLINRRGGGSFLTNTSHSSYLTFGF